MNDRNAELSAKPDLSGAFIWPVRVYWEDTDAGGIVYYANYLKFMERARTEWLRSVGIEQELLHEREQAMFVVVRVEADYRQPARYGDALHVTCDIEKQTRASLTFKQDVLRATSGDVLVSGSVRVACLDAVKFRPRPLPEAVLLHIGQIGRVAKFGEESADVR
jgi:acyl-CoA thioester hydrolase